MGMREISGADLSVGGEGQQAFYDKIIPNVARKYVKTLGGTVEPVEMDFGEGHGRDAWDDKRAAEFLLQHDDGDRTDTELELLARWSEDGVPPRDILQTNAERRLWDEVRRAGTELGDDGPSSSGGKQTVFSIPITPALRQKILSGQRLFSVGAVGAGAAAAASQKDRK